MVPCYVSRVDATGNLIMVSPWGDAAFIKATALSPIPTSLSDGRRIQGIPSKGDACMCMVVDGRYYIQGYFNTPMYNTGETTTIVPELEGLHPLENGSIHKISALGQIVYRKSNQVVTWLGNWANEKIDGFALLDDSRDETRSYKYANFVKRAWGGLTKWTRIKDKDKDYIEWKTNYTDVKTRSHELDTITDYELDQLVRNNSIDDVQQAETSDSPGPQNPANSNYIDKVITRAGDIDGDTHVYEREVRQSKLGDKEKTVFTRLREGHREGVLSEYETRDQLAFTQTSENIGAMPDGRVLSNEYVQASDIDGTVVESLVEGFGKTDTDIYNWKLTNSAGKTIDIQATDTGFNIVLDDDASTLNLDAKLITFGREPDTGLVRYTELKAALDGIWKFAQDHDHNTGVGPSTPAKTGGPGSVAALADPAVAAINTKLTDMESQNTRVK